MLRRSIRADSAATWRQRGYTLSSLLLTIAVLCILGTLAASAYSSYLVRNSRSAAMSELIALAGMQEKIRLNTGKYTTNLTIFYNGQVSGGLGVKAQSTTVDGRYDLSLTASDNAYTITATPKPDGSQADDGVLIIASTGARTRAGKAW